MPQERPAMRSIRCNVLLVSPRFAGRSFWNLTATGTTPEQSKVKGAMRETQFR